MPADRASQNKTWEISTLAFALEEFVLGCSENFFFPLNCARAAISKAFWGVRYLAVTGDFIKFGPNSHFLLEKLQSKIPIWLSAVVQLSIGKRQIIW